MFVVNPKVYVYQTWYDIQSLETFIFEEFISLGQNKKSLSLNQKTTTRKSSQSLHSPSNLLSTIIINRTIEGFPKRVPIVILYNQLTYFHGTGMTLYVSLFWSYPCDRVTKVKQSLRNTPSQGGRRENGLRPRELEPNTW